MGLARGYVGRAELTAEKFIEHPYKKGSRLYRTGDRGRWLSDGNIEYLGRRDDQVKVRGYRVELGEVEGVLKGLEGVVSGCVVVRPGAGGGPQLTGCYVAERGWLQEVEQG